MSSTTSPLPAVTSCCSRCRGWCGRSMRCAGAPTHCSDRSSTSTTLGRWRSNFEQVIEYCRRPGAPGAGIAEQLKPRGTDYFVLKPGQSGFYQTRLPTLLRHLKVSNLVLAGVAGDQCVLTTAIDAHIRDFGLWVPEDATASITPKRNRRALDYIAEVLGASVSSVER